MLKQSKNFFSLFFKIWIKHISSFIFGSILTLSFAPFNCWILAFISIAIFYLNIYKLSPLQALCNGFLFGFGLFITAVSWVYVSIHIYGSAPIWLAGLITVIFCAGLSLLFALQAFVWNKYLKTNNLLLNIASFSALWVVMEILRRWLLGGFPWVYLGYSQTNSHLSVFAPIGGVYLISFVCVLISASVVSFIFNPNYKQKILIILLIFIPNLIGIALFNYEWTKPYGKQLTVSLIQGNVEQKMKWDEEYFNYQLLLHKDLALQSPASDIIVMSENAVPLLLEYAQYYLNQITAKLPNTTLITGVPLRKFNNGKSNYYNALYLQNATSTGIYLKQQLVPFGEYVPMQDLLRGLIDFFDLPMSDFMAGEANQPLLSTNKNNIAAFICYEAAYPDLITKLAKNSNFLLTVSNDTWFGTSIGPEQHLQIAQMRAIENARPLLRATNNGITVFVDHMGNIYQIAPQFTQTILHGQIQPRTGNTPYMLWQNWPLLFLSYVVLFWALVKRYKDKNNIGD